MKKILIVFGTRPEAIKMAPLVKEFKKSNHHIICKVCVTAQHREMLDQVLDLFDIVPEYDLDIMKAGQDLYDVTSNVLLGMRHVLSDFKPDLVFVHGDTSTTFSTSLAAFYQQIPVAHVEAGLRTGDIYSPWPEEANRKLTSQVTHYHFAPTETSKNNLINEGVSDKSILVTGNTVIDALFWALKKIKSNQQLEINIVKQIKSLGFNLDKNRNIILVTGHRRENHGKGLLNICSALKEIAQNNKNVDIVYPVHLNPNVLIPVRKMLKGIKNIYLLEPLQYEQFIYLMDNSYFVITDSGGIQEEAPSLGKPVLVMRETTERPEALDAGTVALVGTNSELIIKKSQQLLDNEIIYKKMSMSHNPYGNGNSSKIIVQYVTRVLNEK